MLTGYFGEDASPTVDGHFLTGDLGRIDDVGNLTITGRIKLLIDIGGRKVNPVEVENTIPFDRDQVHASYDSEHVARWWRIRPCPAARDAHQDQ